MQSLLKNVLEIVYQQSCGGCGSKGKVICIDCQDSFKEVDEAFTCPVCGRWIGKRLICGECITNKRGFTEGYYGFYFENRLRDAVHAFKFNGRKDVGVYLMSLLDKKIKPLSEKIDCIVPVPVTEKRLRVRGFNQSFIISEEIAHITKSVVYDSVLYKIKETKDQYSLSKEERERNIKGAFSLKNENIIRGKKILLVDDLFTTGNTAKEAARVLLKAKPRSIIFFALARTPS